VIALSRRMRAEPSNRLQPQSTRRVLLADADDATRSMYRAAFTPAGYDVVEASEGREALATALTRLPTVVVTEIWLPLIDGSALFEILRADHDAPRPDSHRHPRGKDQERARLAGADSCS
jgi:CheY-like chemotaxis protein